MALVRRQKAAAGVQPSGPVASESFVWDYPCVLEFMSLSSWEPGVVRLPGTVMILLDESRWKLWAHDRDSSESLFVSGETLESCFQSLEQHLSSGSGEWRRDKGSSSGNGRKRT